MIDKMGFEAECFFDSMLMHGDKADAIHQTGPGVSQIHPELTGPLMKILIHPPDVQHAQYIPVPRNWM
jgi:hypothetical protein